MIPKRIPDWYWPWAAWRLGGRKGKRPASAPKFIPAWAYVKLAAQIALNKPPPYAGFFARDGALLRNPRGGVDDIPKMKAAGLKWVALNVGDYPGLQWMNIRLLCNQAGIDVIPWQRCYKETDVIHLMGIATDWASEALVVNLEDEGWRQTEMGFLPPEKVGELLAPWQEEVAVSTVGFPPAWPKWKAIKGAVGLMQAFMNERTDLTPKVCTDRGKECGFVASFPTFGVYSAKFPWSKKMYLDLWNGPWSLYTWDDSNTVW